MYDRTHCRRYLGKMQSLASGFLGFICLLTISVIAEELPPSEGSPASSDSSKIKLEIDRARARYKKTASPLQVAVARRQLEKFPVWRKTKKYRKSMAEEDKIWVVAKTRDSAGSGLKQELAIAGAGMTTASKARAFSVLKNFGSWAELGEYIHRSEYDSKRQKLYLHLKALGYYAKMFLDVRLHDSEEFSDLYMKVTRGHFLGMVVAFRVLKDAKSRKSEILMTAVHPFETLPLPKSFIEFGLEFVFQHIAQKLRSQMQSVN